MSRPDLIYIVSSRSGFSILVKGEKKRYELFYYLVA